jgi:hypothetical protein
MPVTRTRRVVLLGAAVVAAIVVAVATVAVVLSEPRYPGPLEVELADDLLEELQAREAEDEFLRERLGGLAALVTDDGTLADCTLGHTPVPSPPATVGTDPVAEVLAATEQIRQLTLHEPVDVRLLDHTEMTDRVTGFFAPRWDDERIDVEHRKLTTLGAVEPDTDLLTLRVDTFAAQVSGYFAGGAQEIGVRADEAPALSPLERVVLAHEFEHALTAENLGRPSTSSADAARAAAAVVEGSAALTMVMYAESVLTHEERERLREELLRRAAAGGLADFSPYLRAELQFPYVEGVRYVCELWRDGGWEAVDDAYRNPPTTTAAVLFPERHGQPSRQPASLGAPPGDGWERVRETDFGAAQLEWLLTAPGGEPSVALDGPRERAAAWDGGELVVWSWHDATALGLALVDRGDGPPLCDTMRTWYEAAFVDDSQDVALTCDGDQVRLGIGPTAATASAIAD